MMKLIDLPPQTEDENFIYNTKEEKGNKIRISTYDKKNKKYCFDICYEISSAGFLTQIDNNNRDYE